MRRLFPVILAVFLIGLTPAGHGDELSRCPSLLTGLKSSIWRNLEIPVCWESSAAAFPKQREWVRDSITQTWQNHSALRFTGWGTCDSSTQTQGIRIGVGDINPYTKGLGSQLQGASNGMMLNFELVRWGGESCASTERKEFCIRAIAVHEFGHALGFAHEQNRADTPEDWCKAEKQGTTGDINITPYDLHSVMNYCNPKWSGDGKLSKEDIAGLQAWYGGKSSGDTDTTGQQSRYDGEWIATLTYSDPGCVKDQVAFTVSGSSVSGRLKTPFGDEVTVAGTLKGNDALLENIQFSLTKTQDVITLKGTILDGQVHSTDCGCGSYKFARKTTTE